MEKIRSEQLLAETYSKENLIEGVDRYLSVCNEMASKAFSTSRDINVTIYQLKYEVALMKLQFNLSIIKEQSL